MSPKLPRVTAAEWTHALERDGWLNSRQRGSHRVYTHPKKPGLVVIPMHAGEDLPPGIIARTLKDAGLTADDLRRLL